MPGLLAGMDAALAFAERFYRVTEAVERIRVQVTPMSSIYAAVARECSLGATIVPAAGLAALIGCTHAADAPREDIALAEGHEQPRREPRA